MVTCDACGAAWDIATVEQCPGCRARRAADRAAPVTRPAADVFEPEPFDVLRLLPSVLAADPHYLPGISGGAVRPVDWYARKAPQWSRAVRVDGQIVAHIGARLNGVAPDGSHAPRERTWEAGMLMVHPQFRRLGLAGLLLGLAHETFGTRLWGTAHIGTVGHHLCRRADWVNGAQITWAGDPVPGVLLLAPALTMPVGLRVA